MRQRSVESYKIASKVFAVHYGTGLASDLLRRELSLYERVKSKPDIIVHINEPENLAVLSKNPLIHEELEGGFRCRFSSATVTWIVKNDGLHVYLTFDENKKSWGRKLRSIQYTHPYENIGQIFHELIVTQRFSSSRMILL